MGKLQMALIFLVVAALCVSGLALSEVFSLKENVSTTLQEVREISDLANRLSDKTQEIEKNVGNVGEEIEKIQESVGSIEKNTADEFRIVNEKIQNINRAIRGLEIEIKSLPLPTKPDGKYDNNWDLFDSKKTPLQSILPAVQILQTELKLLVPKREKGKILKDEQGNLIKEERIFRLRCGGIIIGRYVITYDSLFDWGTRILMDPKKLPPEVEIVEPDRTYLVEMGYVNLVRVDDPFRDGNVLVENNLALFKIPEELPVESFPYELGDSDKLEPTNVMWLIEYTSIGKIGRPATVTSLFITDFLRAIGLKGENSFMYSAPAYQGFLPGGALIGILDGKPQLVGMATTPFSAMRINEIINLVKRETGIDLREEQKR